jgi:hypothetical protein
MIQGIAHKERQQMQCNAIGYEAQSNAINAAQCQPSSFLVFLFTASRFPISYELIMIAQAGATFKHRAAQPLNNPGTPSVQ